MALWLIAVAVVVVSYFIFATRKPKDVRGKIVLITGGASGMGLGLARKFADLGSRVVIWDINAKGLAEVETELKSKNVDVHTYVCDVSDRKNVYAVAEQVKNQVGKVDILINNAGIVIGKTFLETTDEQSEKVMRINSMAIMWTVKAFLPDMLKSSGHLVTIASAAGIGGTAKLVDYCTSKHAAIGFMDSLRHELMWQEVKNIEFTTINPFYVNTGMFEGAKTMMLFPILEPESVIARIVQGILRNEVEVFIPSHLKIRFFLHLFPVGLNDFLSRILGLDKTMEQFKGRQQQ